MICSSSQHFRYSSSLCVVFILGLRLANYTIKNKRPTKREIAKSVAGLWNELSVEVNLRIRRELLMCGVHGKEKELRKQRRVYLLFVFILPSDMNVWPGVCLSRIGSPAEKLNLESSLFQTSLFRGSPCCSNISDNNKYLGMMYCSRCVSVFFLSVYRRHVTEAKFNWSQVSSYNIRFSVAMGIVWNSVIWFNVLVMYLTDIFTGTV